MLYYHTYIQQRVMNACVYTYCIHAYIRSSLLHAVTWTKPHLLSEHPPHSYQSTSQQYQHDLPQ